MRTLLERQLLEVSAFLDACPERPTSLGDALPIMSKGVPSLRALVESNPDLYRSEDRLMLERCLYDMVEDEQPIERFVEFGLWVLDNCKSHGVEAFFEKLHSTTFKEFLSKELFRYSLLHKRHQTVLLPNTVQARCEREWCNQPGIYFCVRCYKKVNRRVAYCSQMCQSKHWTTHRHICGRHEPLSSVEERVALVTESCTY